MSINRENYLLAAAYNDFSGASPLYHALPSFSRFHSDPRRTRTSLNPLTITSSKINLLSPGTFTALPLKTSFASSGQFLKKKSTSTRLSDQLKKQQHNKRKKRREFILLEEFISPVAVEPESSSSQPSQPFSGSFKALSPNQVNETSLRRERQDSVFSETFYARIHEFLDNERLDVMDMEDYSKGNLCFFKLKEIRNDAEKDITINIDISSLKEMRSATQSPRIISNNIGCSTLFQRRASRSQGRSVGDFKSYRPNKLNTFNHFKDEILMLASPIEEKDTPSMSRNNSGYQGNTPIGSNPRKVFLKHLFSPASMESKTPEERKSLSNMARSSAKLKILQSSLELKSPQISMGSSPLKVQKEKVSFSQDPSPTEDSKLKSIQSIDIPLSKNGIAVRKSRFQKLHEF